MKPKKTTDNKNLRQKAEEKLKVIRKTAPLDSFNDFEIRRMVHELEVHKIELEMQNQELLRTQQELEASYARHFDLFDLAPVGYFILNDQGSILESNLTISEMLGIDRSKLIGMAINHFIFPEDQDIYYQNHNKLCESSTPHTCELRILRSHAEPFWARIDESITLAMDGTKVYLGVISNITERKLVEQKLAASEAELRTIFATMSDVVIVYDADGRYIRIAPTNPQNFTSTPEKMLGKSVFEILPKEKAEYLLKKIQAALKSGTIVNGEYSLDISGNEIWFTFNATPLPDKTVLWIAQDITERKKSEENLAQSYEQLRSLTAYWQSAIEDERTHIAREIHDEFGQSMTALKMDLAWLKNHLPIGDRREERIQSMNSLVDDSITLMRRIATDLRPNLLDDLGLNATLEWQAQEFSRRSGIICKLNLPEQDLGLEPKLNTTLFRIFQEVFTNVTRHAGATFVEASLYIKDRHIYLQIYDNGRGITQKEINDRVSLGLLGLRERAIQFGGETTIQGNPGKGTSVIVRIPLSDLPPSKVEP